MSCSLNTVMEEARIVFRYSPKISIYERNASPTGDRYRSLRSSMTFAPFPCGISIAYASVVALLA